MFVAASSRCFAHLPFEAAMRQLVDLEFSYVEIFIHEQDGPLKPSEVYANFDQTLQSVRQIHRLTPAAFSVDIQAPEDQYYRQFAACCRLAKAAKVVTITVRASELGTPYNAEVERLRTMAGIATVEGVRVGLLTEAGRMTEDPATAAVLCDNVKGLGITLDPSHYHFGPKAGANYDNLFRYTYHTRLRDTSRERLQVRIGQGEVEYSRLIAQLARFQYNRALCIDIVPADDVDQLAELRKIRLLLESML